MQADVVDGVELVAQSEQRHMPPADHHHLAGPGGEVGHLADAHPGRRVGHCYLRAAGVSEVSRFSLPRM